MISLLDTRYTMLPHVASRIGLVCTLATCNLLFIYVILMESTKTGHLLEYHYVFKRMEPGII